jgi:hypothetical protein
MVQEVDAFLSYPVSLHDDSVRHRIPPNEKGDILRLLNKTMAASGAVAVLIALSSTTPMASRQAGGEDDHRVTICHVDGQDRFHQITVDHHAVPAHLDHGDMYPDEQGNCAPGGDDDSDGGSLSD